MPISQTEAQLLIQRGFNGNLRSIVRAVRGLIDGDFISSQTDSGSGTAGTATALRALVLDANKGVGGFRNTSILQEYGQAAPGILNATGTLTAALILTGIVTSTTAAAVTATLDTGTLFETGLLALYPGLQNNDSIEFSVINTGANGFTIATAANWTDGGGGFTAVAAGTSARFLARRTAANTYTLYKIA